VTHNFLNSPKFVEVIGALLIGSGFLVLGPFKYFPFHKSLVTIIIGMTIHGFGLGASVVGGFSDAHKSAIKCGFPDTIDTYGLISGLWTSVFAFGAFVGPTFGGVLYDAVTFRWAIFLIVIGELLSLIGLVAFLVYDVCTAHKREYTRMDSSNDEVPELSANSYGSVAHDNNRSIPVTGARTRKYSESVGRSYVASDVARSMSIARPSGFAAAGIGAGSDARGGGEDEQLIA